MKSRQRRLKAIELTLTPKQVVVVWLRNALQAGTFEEGARHLPPYRGTVANAVYDTVRNSMKGQPDPLVERAILQARREADLLYNLVVVANVQVIETALQREREYTLLLGFLSAEIRGKASKDRVEILRLAFLMVIEPVFILDAAITQVAAERLIGQPVLFRDTAAKLEEQLKMVTDLTTWFNEAAVKVASAQIDLEEVRDNLQSEIDRQISTWVHFARTAALSLFGTEKETHAAMERGFLLFKSNSGEASDNFADP
jgi:hypothetical protein